MKRNPSQPREAPAQAQRKARVGVVHPDRHDASGACEPCHGGEGGARVGRVVQHAGADHHVEGPAPQPGRAQVRLDELHVAHAVPRGRVAGQLEGGPRQVGADDAPFGAGEEEAELPRAAADLQHARVRREWPRRARARARCAGRGRAAPGGCRAAGTRETARARRTRGPLRCVRPRAPGGRGCPPAPSYCTPHDSQRRLRSSPAQRGQASRSVLRRSHTRTGPAPRRRPRRPAGGP